MSRQEFLGHTESACYICGSVGSAQLLTAWDLRLPPALSF